MKTHSVFSFFILCYFIFSPNECRGLCQGEKIKVAQNEKQKMWDFTFHIPKIWKILKHLDRSFHKA